MPFRNEDGSLTPLAYFLIAAGVSALLVLVLVLVLLWFKKSGGGSDPYYLDYQIQKTTSSGSV